MKRILVVLALPALALACTKAPSTAQEEQAAPPRHVPAAVADADGLYICHMGADCGKEQVTKGSPIPGCCGSPMLKAATYTCEKCNKQKITSAAAKPPTCCAKAPMKKVSP